jgi:NAD(P)-dependent dehydrogenase (short-subunit alcohol dehydrogenase family)
MATNKKVALVTGASAGIGKAIVRQLLSDGWVVYGAARRTDKMEDIAKEGAKTLALEWGGQGIRVNAVSPGGMDTNMIAEYQGEEAAARQRAGAVQSVLRRVAQPEEVAAAFAFLASDDGSYVTGTNLIVDGGVTAGVPPAR